jgi:adenylate cyclase
MAYEIERRFLARNEGWISEQALEISQGYLCVNQEYIVRVRRCAQQAFLAVKGKTNGIARKEFEYKIPVPDAQELLSLVPPGNIIQKIRHRVIFADKIWEIDVFAGQNTGLILAEIELEHEEEAFALPPWIITEVTHDARYTNAALAHNPYSRWK